MVNIHTSLRMTKIILFKNRANYTFNELYPLKSIDDIWDRKQADQTHLRFIGAENNFETAILGTDWKSKINRCKDFDYMKQAYILCVGYLEFVEMIFIKDKDFWAATPSKSYYFPEILATSKNKYSAELARLKLFKNKKILSDQEYQNQNQILQSIMSYESNDYIKNLQKNKEYEYAKFKYEIGWQTDNIIRYKYLKLSRFEQLKNCIEVLAASTELNNFISKIRRKDIIDRLIIKFAKLVDEKFSGSSYYDYQNINDALKSLIEKIDSIHKDVLTEKKSIDKKLPTLRMEVLPEMPFSIKLEDFFIDIPIDLEFYEFSNDNLAYTEGVSIIRYESMNTLYGLSFKNTIPKTPFYITILYDTIYGSEEYKIYTMLNIQIGNFTINDQFHNSGKDQMPNSKGIISKTFSLIWNLLVTILFLSILILLVWIVFKIYKSGDCSSTLEIILETLSFVFSVLKKFLYFLYTILRKAFTSMKNLISGSRKYKVLIKQTPIDSENPGRNTIQYGDRNRTYRKIDKLL